MNTFDSMYSALKRRYASVWPTDTPSLQDMYVKWLDEQGFANWDEVHSFYAAAAGAAVSTDARENEWRYWYMLANGRGILEQATFWVDAESGAVNLGTAGAVLNPQLGSAAGADTNDPTLLNYSGTDYVYFPGVNGNVLSIPDPADLAGSSELDVRFSAALDDWTPATSSAFITQGSTSAPASSFRWLIFNDGRFRVELSDGTAWNSAQTAAGVFSAALVDGQPAINRFTWRASDQRVQLFQKVGVAEKDLAAEKASNTGWTLVSTLTMPGSLASVIDIAAPLSFGGYASGSSILPGKLYGLSISKVIDGAPWFNTDVSVDSVDGSSVSYVASTGQTVSISRAAAGRKTAVVTRPVWMFGTDDYMEVADNSLLNFGASDSGTIVWVGRKWATPTNNARYLDKWPAVGSAGWVVATDATNPRIPLGYTTDGVDTVQSNGGVGGVYGANECLSLIIDRDGAQQRTYINGALQDTDSIAAVGDLTNTTPMRIGRASVSPGTSYGDFELLAVAVFRRVLTVEELSAIASYYGAS